LKTAGVNCRLWSARGKIGSHTRFWTTATLTGRASSCQGGRGGRTLLERGGEGEKNVGALTQGYAKRLQHLWKKKQFLGIPIGGGRKLGAVFPLATWGMRYFYLDPASETDTYQLPSRKEGKGKRGGPGIPISSSLREDNAADRAPSVCPSVPFFHRKKEQNRSCGEGCVLLILLVSGEQACSQEG